MSEPLLVLDDDLGYSEEDYAEDESETPNEIIIPEEFSECTIILPSSMGFTDQVVNLVQDRLNCIIKNRSTYQLTIQFNSMTPQIRESLKILLVEMQTIILNYSFRNPEISFN